MHRAGEILLCLVVLVSLKFKLSVGRDICRKASEWGHDCNHCSSPECIPLGGKADAQCNRGRVAVSREICHRLSLELCIYYPGHNPY